MKLSAPFLQLPILFDADRLAAEVLAIEEACWKPHPQGFPGNDALLLVSASGDPDDDQVGGAMAATPHLKRCPYLMQTLDALGATWGRTRLMRLSGAAEVSPHVDTNYYWREHMRVHVPIVTQPTVRFHCGDDMINMAAGECWIFDTWSRHWVVNDAVQARIHLVADTVGGEGLWPMIRAARRHDDRRADWAPKRLEPSEGPTPALDYEQVNAPKVMSPWEIRFHCGFIVGEAQPHPGLEALAEAMNRFAFAWHGLWARFGDSPEGRPRYRALLDAAAREFTELGANDMKLRNEVVLGYALAVSVIGMALGDDTAQVAVERRDDPTAAPAQAAAAARPAAPTPAPSVKTFSMAARMGGSGPIAVRPAATVTPASRPASAGRDSAFERPVFIVSAPRSGSTMLFETLSQAPGVFTVGGESHWVIEAIDQLAPAARGFESNRLTAGDADPKTVAALREQFWSHLRDRSGKAPPGGPVRMLEKTPKNSLRIPFLRAVFPEAVFVLLYREPREVLASMMEAWTSGKFVTYADLPGWAGPPWSLLLTPGWRELAGKPLHEIVAAQWASTTRLLLDDLSALPRDRWRSIRYDRLVAAPEAEVRRLCGELGLGWDRSLGDKLPQARYTLTAPEPDKWRRRAAEVEAVLASIAPQMARAERLVEAQGLAHSGV